MPPDAQTREFVRRRAGFVCEYCGISETDAGGELTIDHYQPVSKGGTDDPDNLIYCCNRCNQHKGDYWPEQPSEIRLWHPGSERPSLHFLELSDGTLRPLSPTGSFTLHRLRLNRDQLITHRLQLRKTARRERDIAAYEQLIEQISAIISRHLALKQEKQGLASELHELLKLFIEEMKHEDETDE
jgi:hypothetical protein